MNSNSFDDSRGIYQDKKNLCREINNLEINQINNEEMRICSTTRSSRSSRSEFGRFSNI